MLNKRAQEEIVGFAVIVIIVSIILLFFLVFSLSSNEDGRDSYEASSFLQSALAYTSSCERGSEFLAIDDLIISCYREERCKNEEYSCKVLNETLVSLISESWQIGPERPVKGYKIEAVSEEQAVFSISEGNMTGSYKGAQQIIPKPDMQIKVFFTAYS